MIIHLRDSNEHCAWRNAKTVLFSVINTEAQNMLARNQVAGKGEAMTDAEWTIVDTETTGLVAPIYAVELAAQRMKGLLPVGEPFQIYLNHDVEVPREAQAVHGYSREFLKENGASPRQAHRAFAKYVGGTALAAYNLPYDYDKVLAPEWSRLGLQAAAPRGFCVMRLTQRLFSPSPAGNYKLQSLRTHFRLPERAAHSALGDVLTVVDLIGSALLPHLKQLGLGDASAISNFLDRSGFPDQLPFGKHKGRHWKEAVGDRDMLGWLEWLRRQDDQGSSKMAEWYLEKVKNEQNFISSNGSQKAASDRRRVNCPGCDQTLGIPNGRAGIVKCPTCLKTFYADTR